MSQQKYYAIVTDKGLSKLRAATQGLGALTLSHMAFGDGNGQETAPSGTALALVNERYRAPITDKKPHPTNPSILYVEAIIPPGVGGWTLREACIYDADGDLIVIAKTPVMDVALLAEGASTEGLVRLPLVFESAQGVQFLIDPTVLLATQSWVIDRIIHRPFITVESITTVNPPVNPTAHVLYVVPTGATGVWTGKANQMAYWYGAWLFADAPKAKVVGASDTGKYYRRTAAGWAEFVGNETEPGFLQFATLAEHKAGARNDRVAHPAGMATTAQSGGWSYAVAGGAVNTLTAALTPALAAYTPGLVINLLISATNTGAASLNVNGLGPKPIVRPNGLALMAGDLLAGRTCKFVYDGANFQLASWSQVITGGCVVFDVSGTWIVPAGVTAVKTRIWGAGAGGGGGGNPSAAGRGGGGGGYSEGRWAVTPGQTIIITVGVGGTGGLNIGTSGTNGGSTSFGGFHTATGGVGGGGTGSGIATAGGNQGTSSGGLVNFPGMAGATGTVINTIYDGGQGGGSFGGGLNYALAIGGPGGNGHYVGAGGGGASGANPGGNGANGMIIIEW